MDARQWEQMSSEIISVEPDMARVLRRLRGPVAWKSPTEVSYRSPMKPAIQSLRSKYDTREEITKLKKIYFGLGMTMRVLGHKAVLLEGSEGKTDSEWYTFKDEGGFLMNEYLLKHVGIRLPSSNFEMAVLNYINCCPVQLNPNFWRLLAIMLCMAENVGVEMTPRMLFYLDYAEVSSGGWVTLKNCSEKNHFNVLSKNLSNIKNWKDHHLFVKWIPKDRRPWYVDAEGFPRFPLWWFRPFEKKGSVKWEDLTMWERQSIYRLKYMGSQNEKEEERWGRVSCDGPC